MVYINHDLYITVMNQNFASHNDLLPVQIDGKGCMEAVSKGIWKFQVSKYMTMLGSIGLQRYQ